MDLRVIGVLITFLTSFETKLTEVDEDDYQLSEEVFQASVLKRLSLCCDLETLESEYSCNSPSGEIQSTSDSIIKSFGHKLNCYSVDIETIQVNVTSIYDSIYNYLPGEDENQMIYLNEVIYSNNSYCVYDVTEIHDHLSMLICSPGCSTMSPCHRKCCEFQQSIRLDDSDDSVSCRNVEAGHSNFPTSWSSKASLMASSPKFVELKLYDDFSGNCGKTPDQIVYDFRISEDGHVEYQHAYNTFIPLENYCVDELLDENETNSKLIVIFCSSDIVNYMWTPLALQLTYSAISCVFVGISVAVYFMIRNEHSIHGWTQFAFLIAAFLFYVMKSIQSASHIFALSRKNMAHKNEIELVDNFFIFGLLLNLVNMNAQVFWTFLKLMPDVKLNNANDFKRLNISLFLCWSSSAFLTLYSTEKGEEQMEYTTITFITIVVILCGLTLCFAFGTLFILCKRFRERSSISSTRDSNSKQMLGVIIRFFCITGLVWTLEILQLLVKKAIFARGWIWDAIQFLIYINGVVLYVVFVCNKKILRSLMKTFPGNSTLCRVDKYFFPKRGAKKNASSASTGKTSSTAKGSSQTTSAS